MGNVVSIVIALVGVLNFVNSMVTSIVSRSSFAPSVTTENSSSTAMMVYSRPSISTVSPTETVGSVCPSSFVMARPAEPQLCKLLVWEGMDYAWITLLCTYVISSLAVGIGSFYHYLSGM